MTKPLLLIDVDGPLNPYASSNRSLARGKEFTCYKLNGFKVWLTRWHGQELNTLADRFELVWCTTWEHDANMLIGPKIGLPKLPVIEFEGQLPATPPVPGLFWKTTVVLQYCKGRPFAWIDDDFRDIDNDYVAEQHDQAALLLHINPEKGLTDPDFKMLAEWAKSLNTEEAS